MKDDGERDALLAKKALLRRILQEEAARGQVRSAGPIPRFEGERPPLSFAQERIWLVENLDPGSNAFNVHAAVEIVGALDVAALALAIDDVVLRHEPLRTTYRLDGDSLSQDIGTGTNRLLVIDADGADLDARRSRVRELLLPALSRGFDVAQGPVYRATLYRLDRERSVLSWLFHHLAVDAWSIQILLRDVAVAYAARRRGEAPSFRSLPVRYRDYAAFQRSAFEGESRARHLAFWKDVLTGAPTRLDLGQDVDPRARGATDSGSLPFAVPVEVSRGLRALAKAEGTTLSTILIAAFKAVVAYETGAREIVVGITFANRPRVELEELVGCFINTLPLRTTVPARGAFVELVRRVKQSTHAIFAHQETPFEAIVRHLQPERDLASTPLFDTLFTVNNTPRQDPSATDGIVLRPFEVGVPSAAFDLVVDCRDGGLLDGAAAGGVVEGTFDYRTSRFTRESVEGLLRRFLAVLGQIAWAPDLKIEALHFVDAAERRRLEIDSGAHVPIEGAVTVVALLEEAIRSHPEAIALETGDARWTYRELGDRSDALARRLQGLGLTAEASVALHARSAPTFVAAALGILKAGCLFVPFDRGWPEDRLAYVRDDAAVACFIAQDAEDAFFDPSVVRIDFEAPSESAPTATSKPVAEPSPRTAAYVIYTSGSTGRPKGVVVEQASMAAHASAVVRAFELSPADRVLQFAHPVFDVALEEIFPTLLAGATVVFRDRDTSGSVDGLFDAIRARNVSIVNLPTALWHVVVDVLATRGTGWPPSVRLLVIGGEAAAPSRWEAQAASGPRPVVLNAYGPTEATVTATVWRGSREAHVHGVVPIGAPLAGVRAYVLDSRGDLAPVGVRGELCLGGGGVSRGYRGLPEKTASAFVPDPFGPAGARMYHTGDLARWRSDGQLEFLGRRDRQVKIRGFRIEIEEVEAALLGALADVEIAVRIQETPSGAPMLVGYAATRAAPIDAGVLAETARRALPTYMRPARWVVLPALPKTAGQKIDRGKLPPVGIDATPGAIGPRTDAERRVAAIVAAILGVPVSGVRDDIFALGGNSLHLVRLVAAVEESFGVRLLLSALIEECTVERIASLVEEPSRPEGPWLSLERRGDRAPLYLFPPAGGTAASYFALARALGGTHPVLVGRGRAVEGGGLERTATVHAATIGADARCFVGGWSIGGLFAFAAARSIARTGSDRVHLVLFDPPLPTVTDAPFEEPSFADFARDAGWAPGRVPETDEERGRFAEYVADLRDVHAYRAAPQPIATTLFLATHGRDEASAELLVAGWRALVGPNLRIVRIAVDHHRLLSGAAATDVAAELLRLELPRGIG